MVLQWFQRRANLRLFEGTARCRRVQRDHGPPRYIRHSERAKRRWLDSAWIHGLACTVPRNGFVPTAQWRHRVLPELECGRRGDASRGGHRWRLHVESDRRVDAHEYVVAEYRDASVEPQQ